MMKQSWLSWITCRSMRIRSMRCLLCWKHVRELGRRTRSTRPTWRRTGDLSPRLRPAARLHELLKAVFLAQLSGRTRRRSSTEISWRKSPDVEGVTRRDTGLRIALCLLQLVPLVGPRWRGSCIQGPPLLVLHPHSPVLWVFHLASAATTWTRTWGSNQCKWSWCSRRHPFCHWLQAMQSLTLEPLRISSVELLLRRWNTSCHWWDCSPSWWMFPWLCRLALVELQKWEE